MSFKSKIIFGDSYTQLESKINGWFEREGKHVVKIHTIKYTGTSVLIIYSTRNEG